MVRQSANRFLRFCSAGFASSALYFILASIITMVLPGFEIVATVVAYLICIAFSFVLQRNYAFRSSGKVKFELVRFTMVSILGLILSTVIVYFGVTRFAISPYASYLIVIATIPILSYVLFSRFVFQGK